MGLSGTVSFVRFLVAALLLAISLPAQALRDDVLIIVNDNSVDSPQVGAYYAQRRGIDPANIVHVQVPDSFFISWEEFRRLRDQLIRFLQLNTLDDPALQPVVCTEGEPPYYCQAAMDQLRNHTRIRYLVTTRGVPTRMTVDGSTLNAPDAPTSVDNYLKYWLINYFTQDTALGFTEREGAFGDGRGMRTVDPATDRELIVGRIDGLDLAAARALVDRAMALERHGIYGAWYGSTKFFRWRDAATGATLYPRSESSLLGWRYALGLWGEDRPECADYLNVAGTLPEGKVPAYCRVRFNDDSDPAAQTTRGVSYPAPGNSGSREPGVVDALGYQGWLDGQASAGSFAALLNWRKDGQCTVTLCDDAADPAACRAVSTDIYGELNTGCVGVADGFMGYNHQSYPVSYLAIWPTGWSGPGHGDQDRLAFPEVRNDEGFDDNHSLWFRNTDQVANPRCYATSDFTLPAGTACPDARRLQLSQSIALGNTPFDANLPPVYRVSLQYQAASISQATPLRVRLRVHETGAGATLIDYGFKTLATVAAGATGWMPARVQFPLDPLRQSGAGYDRIDLVFDTAGSFSGELGIDVVSVQEVSQGVELALNGSFIEGQHQVAIGDHAATFLNRFSGVAFWGSVGHHQSAGCAFCFNGLESLVYFLRGLPLGDAVWFNESNNSGILYGDPLYSPVAVRLNPVNTTDTVSGVVELHGSTVNGRDPARVETRYVVDYCAGSDFFVCDRTRGWNLTGINGIGGGTAQSLGSWDSSTQTPGPYVLRLAVASVDAVTGRSQTLNDYYPVLVKGVAPVLDNNGVNGLVLIEEGSLTVDFAASDADPGDTLTFSAAISSPGNAVFSGGSLTFSAGAAGTNTLTVMVTDSMGLTDSRVIPVTVNAAASSDANGDGITDEQALANGLDPVQAIGDTDGDGIADALELGSPANAADSDGDGVIDALEVGRAASDASTLHFVITPGVAQTLGLDSYANAPVQIAVPAGETLLAQRNRLTGMPLFIESDFPVSDSQYEYPEGLLSFSIGLPAGQSSTTVTIQLPSGLPLPDNAVVRKPDAAGNWRTVTNAVIDRVQRSIVLTLVDNDGVFDADPATGIIHDPVGIAVPVAVVDSGIEVPVAVTDSSSGGGGGGCVLRVAGRQGVCDPLFGFVILLAVVYLRRSGSGRAGVTSTLRNLRTHLG